MFGQVLRAIKVAPGLGPVRFTQDGRFAFVLNTTQGKAYVIDASSNELVHTIETEALPFQVSFSRPFAHLRGEIRARLGLIGRLEV